jgi:hypothetical protein
MLHLAYVGAIKHMVQMHVFVFQRVPIACRCSMVTGKQVAAYVLACRPSMCTGKQVWAYVLEWQRLNGVCTAQIIQRDSTKSQISHVKQATQVCSP